MAHYKPVGYTDLAPYLIVPDAQAVLDFAKTCFDGHALRVIRRSDGSIMHAETRIGDTVLMMGEAPGGPAAHLHLYLPQPDAAFARALAAGGTLVQEMTETGDGDRRGGVTSPDGTTWWLAQEIEAGSAHVQAEQPDGS